MQCVLMDIFNAIDQIFGICSAMLISSSPELVLTSLIRISVSTLNGLF